MPLTDAQRHALPAIRANFSNLSIPLGTALSVDERARLPEPGSFPTDIAVRVEIAEPSPSTHPLLAATDALKTPERVPIFFYELRGAGAEEAPTVDPDTRVLFFIHGGGNIVGHPAHHAPFVTFYTHLLRTFGAHPGGAGRKPRVVLAAPSYRLATVPENTFPAALQDVMAAYEHITARYDPANVVVGGDSAGGGHAIVLTHLILESGGPAPAGVVAIAPAAHLAYDRWSEEAKSLAATTDILGLEVGRQMIECYVRESGLSLADPLVSGAFLSFSSVWPRTLILVGSGDQLIDGAREVDRRLKALGRPVEYVEYDERPHGWWVMPQIFPEDTQDTAERIARFIFQ